MNKSKVSSQVFCLTFGLGLSIFGIISLMFIIPSNVNTRISKEVALKDGWDMRKIWSELSNSYELHAYFFNVTNPDEILMGEKPILKEFGPYIYDLWQEKLNLVDHEEDDTLSYTLKKTFMFNASKSEPFSESDEFTLAHFFILGGSNLIIRTKPALIPLASKAIDSVWNKPTSIFVKTTVKTYLFDGFEINCLEPEDFFARAVCYDIREMWFDYRIRKITDDFYRFSIWSTFNDTVAWSGESRISRGIRNITRIGELVEYNNTNNFDKWGDEKCNSFFGTDGTMFRPFLNWGDDLHVVNTWLRRSLTYRFDSDVTHNGVKCFRYIATIGTDLETNPQDKCYCLAPNNCLKNGVFEAWKPLKWPVVISNPHFYLADPYYNDRIIGLKPKKEKHISIIDVHPLTGIIVSAKFRMQINAPLTNQPRYRLLKNVSEALLPLGWYEERFTMPKEDIDRLKKLISAIAFEKRFNYVTIAVGLILLSAGIFLNVRKRSQPIEPTETTNSGISYQ